MFYYTRILRGKGLASGVDTSEVDSVDRRCVGNSGQQGDSARSDGRMTMIVPDLVWDTGLLRAKRPTKTPAEMSYRGRKGKWGLSDDNQMLSSSRMLATTQMLLYARRRRVGPRIRQWAAMRWRPLATRPSISAACFRCRVT